MPYLITTTMSHKPSTARPARHHVGSKEIFMQEREQQHATEQGKRRKMQPCTGKDEPTFDVETPWDGRDEK